MENETKKETVSEEVKEEPRNVVSPLDKAKELAERLERANARGEELAAREILSGKADAGQTPVKPVEQTPQEYSQDLLDGKVKLE